jgi:hypothetical protein
MQFTSIFQDTPNNMKISKQNLSNWQSANLLLLMISLFIFSCEYDSREDFESPTCQTDAVTFHEDVQLIVDAHCIGCHTATNPSGGLNFDSHPGIAAAALNGSLVGAIKHLPGFEPMPLFAPKLSDCEIAIIEEWVNNGAADN